MENDTLLAPRPSAQRGNVVRAWMCRNAALVALSAVLAAGVAPQAGTLVAQAALAQEGAGLQEAFAPQAGASAVFEKSEVVYAALDLAGKPEAAYVVNRFDVEEAGCIVDFGSYTMAKNLSTTDALALEDGAVSFDAAEGTFFYQGNMGDVALPWKVSLEYFLDGKEADPAFLAGASGRVEVRLFTSQNPDVDPAFFDSFMLQATFTLDSAKCSHISAEGATVADAGAGQSVAFTVLPGHDASFTLSMDVADFEMAGVQIVGIPYSSPVEVPDTSAMTEGMQQLADGVSALSGGAGELAGGGQGIVEGARSLAGGISQARSGAAQAASGGGSVVEGAEAMGDALGRQAQGLSQLSAQLEALDTSLLPPDVAAQLEALKSGVAASCAGMEQIDGGFSAYEAGVRDYVAGVEGLEGGLAALESGADELAAGVRDYVAGVDGLNGAVKSLDAETSQLPATVQGEIDGMLAEFEFPEFRSVSFASAENAPVRSVQFVMTTPAIEKAAEDAPAEDEEEAEAKTFGERLLDLFG